MPINVPECLQSIPNPPKTLYATGVDMEEIMRRSRVAIVGSRKVTSYGKNVTTTFAHELARQGIVVVSGLAFGVDALAHTAALEAGGLTVAVLPTGLDKVYPSSHRQLAKCITRQGMLLTEYPDGTLPLKHNFIERNRIVSGISDAVLITEAAEKSGTLHTARHAIEQGRKVFAVPGNITSPMSAGTNQLIKTGATPVTSPEDILAVFGITPQKQQKMKPKSSDPNEQKIINLLYAGTTDSTELQQQSGLEIPLFNQTLTMLEISGVIKSLGNNHFSLL